MSYLITQMFLYLLATFLLGLILGWLIWRYGQGAGGNLAAIRAERDALAAEGQELRSKLNVCQSRLVADMAAKTTSPAPAARSAMAAAVAAIPEGGGTKPEGLSAPRGGQADNLQEISGVGPKMEKLLYELGYYHFDQIARWTPSEVAWVDDNLEGFKGRVSRDNWIDQAKILMQS